MAEEKMEVVRMDIPSVFIMKRVVEYSQGCNFTVRVIVSYYVLTYYVTVECIIRRDITDIC